VNLLSLKIIHINLLSEIPKSDIMDILKVADRINIDLIWLGFGNISYPILKFIKESSNYKVVLDTDSIWSQFILRELPLVTNKKERQKIEDRGRKKEEEERWGTQLADVTTAVSKIDADYYIGLAKDKEKVHIFSNVIDVESYQNIPSPATNFKNPCIYLAGTFWSRSPMEDAARWVIKEVLPLVRSKIPDIHFYIVGSNSDRILSDIDDPGITITGKVPSVLPYLCYANVALVPLRFESGTRFKILEAGACGIPVVSTTLGAEGIPVTHEKDILIANEPSGFSNSIIKLVREPDLAKEMAEKLKTLVQEKYSVASLTQEGDSILKSLKIIC
jgi:glycosyltransferase involved in cell wall biosynthesis